MSVALVYEIISSGNSPMRTTKKFILMAFAIVGVIATGNMLATSAFAGQKAAQKPAIAKPAGKITPWAAMEIANKKTGAKPVMSLFEFEGGKWVYGVIVVKNHKLQEVIVDASTGAVGDVEAVTPAEEAKEISGELEKLAKEN